MKTIKTMFIAASLLTLVASCSGLPAQRVSLDKKSVQAISKSFSIKGKGVKASRSARFLQCVKDLNFEGIKQSLLVKTCEAAMGSIR